MGTACLLTSAHVPFVRMDKRSVPTSLHRHPGRQGDLRQVPELQPSGARALQDPVGLQRLSGHADPQGVGTGVSSGANRICFSEFEHGAGDGWGTYTSGPAVTTSLSTIGGIVNRVIWRRR